MIPQLSFDDVGRRKGIGNGAHRFISEGQGLLSSRNSLMQLAAFFAETPAELCPIAQQQRADLRQLIIESFDQLHRRPGLFLLKQAAFAFQQLFIPGQQIAVSGTDLTDGAVQKIPPTGGRAFDQIEILG